MGFQQGLSGLNASAKALDVIGNNIANANTVGFKVGQTQFADVFAASLSGAGAAPTGLGTKVAAIVQQFTQGNITVTNNPLDTAINGSGFFQLDDGLGGTLYSRNGQFQLDQTGYIVNAQGLQLKGIVADADGLIPTGAPTSALRLFDPTQKLTGEPQATGTSTAASGVEANINFDSRLVAPTVAPFDYLNPRTYNQSTAVTIYDSLGNDHTFSLYFVKDAAVNTWNVYATVTNPDKSVADLGTLGQLNFDTDGTLLSSTVPSVAPGITVTAAQLGFPGGVDDLQFPVNFESSTQYGSKFAVNALIQDGYAPGTLAGFGIGEDGIVLGRYTNGQSKAVGQIVLATFRNPQGLQALGNNVWSLTPQSGPAITGTPGSSGQFGALQSAALEDANIDLTAELVTMIMQQRVYQANAQTIKTQDQVLQTLVNLR